MTHCLKTWPEFFADIASGHKTFEIRYNDRDFRLGDVLILQEYEPSPRDRYTRKEIHVEVTYITSFQQKDRWVVMGIRRIK